MENMNTSKRYSRLLAALVIGSLVTINFAQSAQLTGDNYKVLINANATSEMLYYTFVKTDVRGNKVYTDPSEAPVEEIKPGTSKIEVVLSGFPALTRDTELTKRATKYTRLLISNNDRALRVKIANNADDKQKDLIVAARVPQKIDGYCYGTLTFNVTKNKQGKLSIKAKDDRTCMLRSGSKAAKKSREEHKKAGESASMGHSEY